MHLKHFHEGEPFRSAGNDFLMLLPRDLSRCCEVVLQKIRPGGKTPSNAHETFLQVYVFLHGEGDLVIGAEERHVESPAVALIPQRTNHYVVNRLSNQELHYLYISMWPDGIPEEEIAGGWKKIYERMIQEYVDRGFAVNG